MKFDLDKFSDQVFRHRNINLKIGREKAANQCKVNECVIRDIETGVSKSPSIHTVVNLCGWMGADINHFVIRT